MWQPIETAPKDGSLILILQYEYSYPRAEIVRWETDEEGNWEPGPEGGTWACPYEADFEYGQTAKYWMPLPAIPPVPCESEEAKLTREREQREFAESMKIYVESVKYDEDHPEEVIQRRMAAQSPLYEPS
jgi:hypothetical protein